MNQSGKTSRKGMSAAKMIITLVPTANTKLGNVTKLMPLKNVAAMLNPTTTGPRKPPLTPPSEE